MFEGQVRHLIALAALAAVAWWAGRLAAVSSGAWGGLGTPVWYWIALAVPVAHQLWVVVVWRLELHGRRLSRALGSAAFPLYAVVFAILFLGRFVALILLARSNHDSVSDWQPWPTVIAVLISIPAVYTFYSVARYFGVLRAFGLDHFDRSVRERGLVRKGIFRFTDNAMYTYGLLALWLPGLLEASAAALVAAALSHVYIWVHYFCTELPDMRRIYG